ncbi:MAG: phosphoribosyltransferase family protein [Candidatus Diapherotrites archaeon]|nr:phosphoribosyltransferase family protein [Candidatus Diapherotrites archaeon]
MVEKRKEQPIVEVSWKDFDKVVEEICSKLRGKKFASVYGIPRGGLPLAVALSHKLEIPLVWSEEELKQVLQRKNSILIVDEIIDSGKTMQKLIDLLSGKNPELRKKVCVVAWFKRHNAEFVPNLFLEEIHGNEWILFPWEKKI